MQTGYEREIQRFQKDLEGSLFKDAESKHRKKLIEIKVCMIAELYCTSHILQVQFKSHILSNFLPSQVKSQYFEWQVKCICTVSDVLQ